MANQSETNQEPASETPHSVEGTRQRRTDGGYQGSDDRDSSQQSSNHPPQQPPQANQSPHSQQPHHQTNQPPQRQQPPQGRTNRPPQQPNRQQGQPPQSQQPRGRGSRGQHPPQQQPAQSRGGRPPQSPPPQGPGGPPPSDGGDDGGLSDDISRRQLLAGGVGVAAVGGIGGWWAFLRGPSGAKGAVDDYYSALNDGNLDALAATLHEDSHTHESIANATSFEELFGQNITNVDFSVEGLYEMHHYTDPRDRNIDPAEVDATEAKEIMAVVEIDESAVPRQEQDREDKDVYKEVDSFGTVLTTDDEWKLWH